MLSASHQPGEIWMIVVQMAPALKIPVLLMYGWADSHSYLSDFAGQLAIITSV